MAGFAGRGNESELGAALRKLRGGLAGIALLSAVLNVLTISGSIYLMMVYDRVLPGSSIPTLLVLFFMITIVYLFQGGFDMMRSQMLADVASTLDRRMTKRIQNIEMKVALERPETKDKVSPTRDLDQLRSFIASAGPPALIDLPWIFFFLIILSLIHYWLGIVTLAGAFVLAGLTYAAEKVSSKHVAAVTDAASKRRAVVDRQWRHVEVISAMGMRGRVMAQWEKVHHKFLDEQSQLTNTTSMLSGLSKVFRMFLQSSVLTVGALLVIDGKATGGVIFASSILSGRALAPVDSAIANWKGFVGARQAWARLNALLKQVPVEEEVGHQLAPPAQQLTVESLALTPPGSKRPAVTEAQFNARAGQAIGIIGPSASGKSSLLRGIIGVWKPARGSVRLDGATIDQWDSEVLGRHIGYLPQSVELFTGTVAENIARFEPDAPSEAITAAAMSAGVHQMILQLPDGYDTPVGEDGTNLSAGQRQRVALARALYREPFLVVLDEPNSNLDPEGEAALARAIVGVKQRGGLVLVAAHRQAILATVDLVLVMQSGKSIGFGPRDEVMAKLQQQAQAAAQAAQGQGGQGGAPGGLTVVSKQG